MRLDRFLTVGLFGPARSFIISSKREPRGVAARVLPILMYHSISRETEHSGRAYYRTCTSPERFRRHMEALTESGWRGVTLSEGLRTLSSPAGPQTSRDKVVALTFDDGYRDFHTHAFPVLQQHGFRASVYIPTAFVAEKRKSFRSRDCVTWAEVTELHAAGVEFGSHTATHPKLVELTWAAIETELRTSKAELEQRLGHGVPHFAYPYAFPARPSFRMRFREALATAGYETCATTNIGRTFVDSDPLELKRLPVNDCDDDVLFSAKLEGTYDWLGVPQAVWKRLKP